MAGAVSPFSCRCLNVRISSSASPPSHPSPPRSIPDPIYNPVFAGDDGISITHPQVTLRTRLQGVAIPGTTRCSRYTTLTCLLCDMAVYRVLQVVPIDVDGAEGPVQPSEDWVERQVLKSPSGWIEVHRDALTGDDIAQAGSSPNFSQTFSLILPSLPCSPDITGEIINAEESSTSAVSPSSPPSYLSNMKPLFFPPPFTPSHPAFIYLASLAEKESQAMRASAEEYIDSIVRNKISEVERSEAQLRKKVELLWKRFRNSMSKIEHEKRQSIQGARSPPSRSRESEVRSGVGNIGSPPYGTPLTVREFVPVPVSASKHSPPASRVSALSASLATSSFHHPRARETSSPDRSESQSPKSATIQSTSTHSGSATLVQPISAGLDGNTVLHFRRNTNDTINTAASHRYFVDLEADMARHKREQEAAKGSQTQKDQSQQAGPSQLPESSTTDGNKKPEKPSSESIPAEDAAAKAEDESDSAREAKSKGKRKVTFDVQPAVVTIKREAEAEKAEAAAALGEEDSRDMIFHFEEGDGAGEQQGITTQNVLQFIEQPPIVRTSRSSRRVQNGSGLPASLASLRPASLPAPSHVRPVRSPPGVDTSSQSIMLSLPRSSAPISQESSWHASRPNATQLNDKPIDDTDAALLELVAANTPSHRGAWQTNSKAWEAFTRRQGSTNSTNIPEEDEYIENGVQAQGSVTTQPVISDDDDQDADDYEEADEPQSPPSGVPASLPISITIRNPPREALSLASYQPNTTLADRTAGSLVSPSLPKNASSAAIRKAAYAERDRSRSMDPGALDFATEEDDIEEENESDEDVSKNVESGGRGRKKALKILEKRSEIPDAGMWRSLAS